MKDYREVRKGIWVKGKRSFLVEVGGELYSIASLSAKYGPSRQTISAWVHEWGMEGPGVEKRLLDYQNRRRAVREGISNHDLDFFRCIIETNTWQPAGSECLYWIGAANPGGQPRFSVGVRFKGQKTYNARRAALFVAGRLRSYANPAGLITVREGCPRNCVNPRHLSLHRSRSSCSRKLGKIRNLGGYANPQTKLSPEKIDTIMEGFDLGLSNREISRELEKEYGLIYCPDTIGAIRRGAIWSSVTGIKKCV